VPFAADVQLNEINTVRDLVPATGDSVKGVFHCAENRD